MLDSLDSYPRRTLEHGRSDHVVLLDPHGRPTATMPKAMAHHEATPLHLAFSCHVLRRDGRALITRRSAHKRTWPGVWSNACCGHPRLGENLRDAVRRHLADELGCRLDRLAIAIYDFTYRAEMSNGIAEHELCPVVVATVDSPIRFDPAETDAVEWIRWEHLQDRARVAPSTLSPWVVAQLAQLPATASATWELLQRPAPSDDALLSAPITIAPPGRAAARRPFDPGDDVLGPVTSVLTSFLSERQRELVDLDATTASLGRAICDLVESGGKRLRPAFVYWGWRAAQGVVEPSARVDTDHDAVVLGAVMELLHTFALLHDDVMDQADTRRGSPSAARSFERGHRERRDRGDPTTFGANAAILAGDLAFVWADQLLDSLTPTPTRMRAVRDVFGRLRAEVIAGQYLDLLAGGAGLDEPAGPSHDTAMTVARLKSARYTVTRPLELGAALGGPLDDSSPTRRALATYGDAIGMSFQMRDDVLDLFGHAAVTGKPALGDLREGKRTVLVERALRLASGPHAARLRAAIDNPALSDDEAHECRDVIAGSGALASVEALIAAQHQIAIAAVAALPNPVRAALTDLASIAVDRET